MLPLILSILPFLLAPFVFERLRGSKKTIDFLDGFIFTSIIGLLLLHLFADSEIPNYFVFILALLAGFSGPNFFEKAMAKQRRQIHMLVLMLSMVGFMVHSMADGIALVEGAHDHGGEHSLKAAILLHRIPDALTIWWLFAPVFGGFFSWIFMLSLVAATGAGFFFGDVFSFSSYPLAFSALQAFVVGTILHVVVFRFHSDALGEEHCCCQHEHSPQKSSFYEGLGSILGFGLFIFFIFHEREEIAGFIDRFQAILYLSAPALLFAYLISSFLNVFFKQRWFDWAGKGNRLMQASKGMIVGLPLPICSCGVLPFYQTLVKRGVPAAAAIAFLIATPELGLDAILISWPLLGAELTLVRLGAAMIFAVVVALCLDYKTKPVISSAVEEVNTIQFSERLKNGFKFGFGELFDSTIPWIAVGIVLAALLEPVLGQIPLSLPYDLEIIVFAMIGAVLYVCASGATPLVAVFIAQGLSAGAAITFLLTGPATNISTFGILADLHGKKFAVKFCLVAVGFSVAIGYLVNFIFPEFQVPGIGHLHDHAPEMWRKVCVAIIVILFFVSLFNNGGRKMVSKLIR